MSLSFFGNVLIILRLSITWNDIDLIDLPALGRTFWHGMSTLYWITCHEIFGDGNIWSIIQKVFVEV